MINQFGRIDRHGHLAPAGMSADKNRLIVQVLKSEIRTAPAHRRIASGRYIGHIPAVGVTLLDDKPCPVHGIKQCRGYLTDPSADPFRELPANDNRSLPVPFRRGSHTDNPVEREMLARKHDGVINGLRGQGNIMRTIFVPRVIKGDVMSDSFVANMGQQLAIDLGMDLQARRFDGQGTAAIEEGIELLSKTIAIQLVTVLFRNDLLVIPNPGIPGA